MHPEKIPKAYKNMVNDLDYESIKFPVSKKKFDKFEKKNNICINVFCYEKIWFILFIYQVKNLKTVSIYC